MGNSLKMDNVGPQLILEDHLKAMNSKFKNKDYRPWKNQYAPKNPHSPFGDFPAN